LRIGVDASRTTRRERTGTENYSVHILGGMLAAQSPHRFRLYLSEPLPPGVIPHAEDHDQRIIRLPRLWTQVGLTAEMLRDPPDVLYVPSHVLPLALPRASVVLAHDVGHRFFPRAHGLAEWIYVELTTRRHVRVATRLITLSEASKQDIVRLYRADPARIDVAYPAADTGFRPQSTDEVERVRGNYDLPARYILHLGTIKPRKNLPRLVAAFGQAQLPQDVVLVIGGRTTSGGPALQRAIAESPVRGRIRVLPYVQSADLPALYAGATVVVVVSLHEGFGIPALEAIACGAPVVVSNVGALPEVVGDAGVLVNPLDVTDIARGLAQLLDDPAHRTELSALGPLRASRFTWQAAADATLRSIERAAG
jgi:glycosyltransferase involved in cell wall biosynthesis